MIELWHSASIHEWHSFPNASIFHKSEVICFNFYVIFTFRSSGWFTIFYHIRECGLCFKDVWFIWIYKMFSNTFLSSFLLLFSSFALPGKNYIHVSLLTSYLLASTRQSRTDFVLYFQTKCFSFLQKFCVLVFF